MIVTSPLLLAVFSDGTRSSFFGITSGRMNWFDGCLIILFSFNSGDGEKVLPLSFSISESRFSNALSISFSSYCLLPDERGLSFCLGRSCWEKSPDMRVLSIMFRLLGPLMDGRPLACEGFIYIVLSSVRLLIEGKDMSCLSKCPFCGGAIGAKFLGATIFARRARSASEKSSFLLAS